MPAKKPESVARAADEKTVASAGDTELVLRNTQTTDDNVQHAGERGPPSSLETGKGGPKADGGNTSKAQSYSVQVHTEDKGLEVKYVTAETGDEAAQKVLAMKDYNRASIRGVTPASDPDANSLGGERDASIMLDNANTAPVISNSLGTEANAKATKELGHADITELKD